MLAHRIRYHCNYAMGKYKCACVCARERVYPYTSLAALDLNIIVHASLSYSDTCDTGTEFEYQWGAQWRYQLNK